MNRLGFRVLFCLVVAVATAALTDPLVEAAANAGWFGPGTFTDHSTIDVVPAILVALLFGLAYVTLRARLLASRSLASASRLRDAFRIGASTSVVPLVPAIVAAELCVLAAMESGEQIVVAGHVLGGTLWLGGPVAIAIAVHAATCVALTFALSRLLDALTRTAMHIVRFVCAFFAAAGRPRPSAAQSFRDRPAFVRLHPLASRSGTRAPPILVS